MQNFLKNDTLLVKCPYCESTVIAKVPYQESREGALVQCKVCGKEFRLAPSHSFLRSLYQEGVVDFIDTLRELGQKIGWSRFLLLLIIWLVGWYVGSHLLHLNQWIAAIVPGVPFMVFLFTVTQERMQRRLGYSREPGPSRAAYIKANSIEEEYQYILSQRCAVCGGPFRMGKLHSLVPASSADSMSYRVAHKANKLYDKIDVVCQQCDKEAEFIFDIDAMEHVQKLGFTDAMVRLHMQLVREYWEQPDTGMDASPRLPRGSGRQS
jgi:hypothetical protein